MSAPGSLVSPSLIAATMPFTGENRSDTAFTDSTLPKGLPDGDYTLHAWHPDLRESRSEVQMPASGDVALDLDW